MSACLAYHVPHEMCAGRGVGGGRRNTFNVLVLSAHSICVIYIHRRDCQLHFTQRAVHAVRYHMSELEARVTENKVFLFNCRICERILI